MRPLKLVLILSMCLIFPLLSSAERPKPIYVDVNGKMYVKSKTPLFLHMAVSPQENAASHLIRNQSSINSKDKALPFRAKGHGEDTIKHLADHRVKQEDLANNVFNIFIDGRSPKLTISNSKAPTVIVGKTKIFGKKVEINIKTIDQDSGLNGSYYSLNDQDYLDYTQPLKLNQEMDYLLKTYAVDNVGNTSKVRTQLYAVDLTPPVTTLQVKDHKEKFEEMVEQHILSPKASIWLRSSDEKAGVKQIGYKLDGKQALYKGKPIKVKNLTEGEHTLVYSAVDKVGNLEADVQFTFFLDKRAPEMAIPVLIGDVYEQDDKLYVSGSSTIELSAKDNKAGVRRIRYNFKSMRSHFYSEPFGFPQRNGKAYFYYAASDKVINVSPKEYQVVIVDITSPSVTAKLIGEHFIRDGIHYVRKTTGINLDARDNLSGIQDVLYDTEGGSAEAVVSSFKEGQAFMILDEGLHDFSFKALDNVNNMSEAKKLKIYVDEVPPEIFHRFSVEKLGGEEEAYSKMTSLFLSATDRQSGVRQVYYKINNGKEVRYRAPIKFNKKGSFKVVVRSIDQVANVSTQEIIFKIR